MADLKISQLSDGGNAQAADEFVVARSGANYRIDGASVAAAATSVGTLSSLTVSGDLTVDTSTLKVDSTNNRVGIGTASPANDLDVSRSAAAGSVIASVVNTSSTGAARIYLGNDGNASAGRVQIFGSSHAVRPNIMTIGTDSSLPLVFDTGGTERARIDTSGNLGLGVTPSAWASSWKAMQIGFTSRSLASTGAGAGDLTLAFNAVFDATDSRWEYAATGDKAGRYSQTGSGDHIWYVTNTTGTAGNAITFTQAMTLDASGNLGVGTGSTAPAGRIDAVASSNGIEYFSFRNSSNGSSARARLRVGNDASENAFTIDTYSSTHATLAYATLIYNQFTAPLLLGADGAEKARITAGGYFKASNAGTYASSTGSYHELRGSATGNTSVTVSHTDTTNPFGIEVIYSAADPNDAGKAFLGCYGQANLRAAFRSNGGLANYQANDANLSDERVKTDIKPVGSYWDKFKAIEIVTFKYKDQTHDDDNIGVIAQQVEAVAPEFIDVDGFGETPEDGVPLKTVYTTDLYHASIKALQEAMARIEALEARLEALEA